MNFRIAELFLVWVLAGHLVGCKGSAGDPCYSDSVCSKGLACFETVCTDVEQVNTIVAERRYAEEAAAGFRKLVYKCKDFHRRLSASESATEEFSATINAQSAGPGETVEINLDEGIMERYMSAQEATDEALLVALRVGVPLRDENPVFRRAVLAVLRERGAADEPGPSSSLAIPFCAPDFLGSLWRKLGEPQVYGVTR